MICDVCEKTIYVNDDYFMSSITGDRCYCSEKCMKKDLRGKFIDEVIDEWFEEKAEAYTEEAEDPYDKYGVDQRDFA